MKLSYRLILRETWKIVWVGGDRDTPEIESPTVSGRRLHDTRLLYEQNLIKVFKGLYD